MCGGLQNSNEGQGATSVSSSLSPRVALKFCNLRHMRVPRKIQTWRKCGCHMEPSLTKPESFVFVCALHPAGRNNLSKGARALPDGKRQWAGRSPLHCAICSLTHQRR